MKVSLSNDDMRGRSSASSSNVARSRWTFILLFGMIFVCGFWYISRHGSLQESFGAAPADDDDLTIPANHHGPPLPKIRFATPMDDGDGDDNGSNDSSLPSPSSNNGKNGTKSSKGGKKEKVLHVKKEVGEGPYNQDGPQFGLWPIIKSSCEWKRPNPPVVIFNRVPKCASTTTLELFQKIANGQLDMPIPHQSLIPKGVNHTHYIQPNYRSSGLPKNLTQANTR
jgi:hypothetical protein